MDPPDKRKAARYSQFDRKKKRTPWNKPIAGGNECFPKTTIISVGQGLILQSSKLD